MVDFGYFSLAAAWAFAGWAAVAAFLAGMGGGPSLLRSAERSVLCATAGIGLATVALLYALVTDDFRLDYVYHYSSTSQALPYKLGALWGGQAGSLLFWVLILAAMASLLVLTNRHKNRALMPFAVAVVSTVMVFFLFLVNVIESPFAMGPARPDGVGLNPQLKNYWMMIHPPSLYLGYVGFTVPFAFAIAALATRRTDDVWFRTTRRWTLFSWFFLGAGILMGSYWAYIELGWGGYWAWDPVENASLMPWLTGTAFLHSVMIQEKKGMLKVWNMLLIILTFSLSIFGTFLTRSGIISSVHAFATSNIGPAFGVFLGLVMFGSFLLLILRLEDLKTEARLESVLSRESSFLFNNLILVGMALTVLFLTTFPILSEAVTGQKVTMGPPIFNLVNLPWALVLLALTGIGPLIAWRKASAANLRRNFVIPALAGLWVWLFVSVLEFRTLAASAGALGASVVRLDVRGFFDALSRFYPGITFGLGAFVAAAVALEFYRGVRARARHGENPLAALANLIWRNKRRYGGYIVHIGVVLVFIGIAGSSAYRKEFTRALRPGESFSAYGYSVRYEGYRLEAVDDHIGAVTELSLFDEGRFVGYLEPEQRFHPNMLFAPVREAFLQAKALHGKDPDAYRDAVVRVYDTIASLEGRVGREVKTPSTEVAIHASLSPFRIHRFGEDFYTIPLWVDPRTGEANFRVFINPMVNFLWLGGLVFVLGAGVCIIPDARERRRALASLEEARRAVA